MRIYAHRGWHNASVPENSMIAFRRAAAEGFGIETDLRTDRSGSLLVFHDRLVGGIPLDRLDHNQIERIAGRTVPTFDELIAASLGVPLNLEIKTRAAWSALLPYIEHGLPKDVLLSSFNHSIVAEAAELPSMNAAYLFASAPASLNMIPSPYPQLSTIIWDFNIFDERLIALARERGLDSMVYGAYTSDEHARLCESKCGAVITDTPEIARRASCS